MTCIVCYSPLRAGLSGWHHTCPACAYESAALAVAINHAAEHAEIVEQGARNLAQGAAAG
jgi:hypothetical protein